MTAGDQFWLRSYSHSFRRALEGKVVVFFLKIISLFSTRRFERRVVSLLTGVPADSLAALIWLTAVSGKRGGCRRAAALDRTDDGCRPFRGGAAGGGVAATPLSIGPECPS